jgi:hypothetical protein
MSSNIFVILGVLLGLGKIIQYCAKLKIFICYSLFGILACTQNNFFSLQRLSSIDWIFLQL